MKKNLSNIKKAINYLNNDDCVAIPTETVYGLAANAYSNKATSKIFKLKNRSKKNPLIVHYYNLKFLKKDCLINKQFLKLYKKYCPGPISFILKLKKDSLISKNVTNKKDTVAIRFPKHSLTRKLLKNLKFPIAAPSANISSRISPVSMEDVKDEQSFRSEINKRMEGEIAQQEKSLTKESIYETLLLSNDFKVPKATVKEQAELMRKDSLMRMGQTVENAADDFFPVKDFLENAEKRVRLDLLFSALIQKYELEVKEEDLNKFIEDESQKYKDIEQFKTWIKTQPEQLNQYKMVILEDLLIEKLDSALKSKQKVIKFSDLANK